MYRRPRFNSKGYAYELLLYKGFALGLLLSVLLLAITSAARADEVTDWHEHMLSALRTAAVNPIVSTRDAALVSAAVFDAVNGIERRYAPIHVAADAPRGASKRAAAVQAAYVILLARFPAQSADLNAKRTTSLAAIGDADGNSLERGVEWGQTVAEAILEWRSTDGFTPPPPPYLGGNAPGHNDKGYGIIEDASGREVYFSHEAVDNRHGFDDLRHGHQLDYTLEKAPYLRACPFGCRPAAPALSPDSW